MGKEVIKLEPKLPKLIDIKKQELLHMLEYLQKKMSNMIV